MRNIRVSEVLQRISDEHKMRASSPLSITFSHSTAMRDFLRLLEADIGMSAGELDLVARREGWSSPKYDGIEFRVAPPKGGLRPTYRPEGVGFWA